MIDPGKPLPCPFCMSAARLDENSWDEPPTFFVSCSNEQCWAWADPKALSRVPWRPRESAVAVWNFRAELLPKTKE